MTDASSTLHLPFAVASEPEPNGAPSHAYRSATGQCRTAPLHALWQHPPYFHNGSAASAEQVVRAYNDKQFLALNEAEVSTPQGI